jgi:hypothetical protein
MIDDNVLFRVRILLCIPLPFSQSLLQAFSSWALGPWILDLWFYDYLNNLGSGCERWCALSGALHTRVAFAVLDGLVTCPVHIVDRKVIFQLASTLVRVSKILLVRTSQGKNIVEPSCALHNTEEEDINELSSQFSHGGFHEHQ